MRGQDRHESRDRIRFGVAVLTLVLASGVGWGARAADHRDAVTAPHHRQRSVTTSPHAEPSTPRHTRPTVYAAIAAGGFSPAVAGVPERVYVPNGVPGTVEVIDPKTFRVIRRMHVGSFPEHVTPSWDLRRLYVDASHSSSLAVIDPRTGRVVRTIRGIDHPYNLYFTVDGKKAIVVAEYHDELDFRDPRTWRLIKRVPIPGNGPDHADFSADGRYLLISTEFDGNVFKVSTGPMRVLGRVHVGGLPVDVKLAPNGSAFYVANQGLSGVSVIDPVRMRQIGFIHTGAGAHGMAVSRDARFLYVSNRLAGTISVIRFATRRVARTWRIGGSPDMLQVSPDGSQLWVSNRFGDTVTVLSTRNGRILHQIVVGPDPHGLTYFPQPGRFSLGHNGVYR